MFVNQPEIPVPLVVEFPFPAWATRVRRSAARRPLRPVAAPADDPVRGARVKILHTSDWHVGKC